MLKLLEERLGKPVSFAEVFIEYEEGRALFPDNSSWQNPAHYPAMRVVPDAIARYSCAFLKSGKCSIHDIKPRLCASFLCEHVHKVVHSVLESCSLYLLVLVLPVRMAKSTTTGR